MTPDEQQFWHRVRKEPNTREDWEDLHDTIEQYKRRYMARHAPKEHADQEQRRTIR